MPPPNVDRYAPHSLPPVHESLECHFGTGPSCPLITTQTRAHFNLMQPLPSYVLVEDYTKNELCERVDI